MHDRDVVNLNVFGIVTKYSNIVYFMRLFVHIWKLWKTESN